MSKLISELSKGAWLIGTAYTVGDIVTSAGSSYICIANDTGHIPPNATYWALLASKGDQGEQGEQGEQGIQGIQGIQGDGNVNGPATNSDSYLPQWDGANSKLLKNGIPTSTFAPALGGDDNYVTDAEKTKLSNLSGTNTGDQTLPVKASGAEINTGTDDAKFATAKAIADSYLGGATSNLQTQISALPTASSTTTFTNKRITKRVVTTTDDATAVIDVDVTDDYQLSAVANATEFTLTGTPTDGQVLIVRYKDAGVSKALTWTGFTAIGTTLPTATTAGKWGYVGCKYNSAASQWHVLAVQTQA